MNPLSKQAYLIITHKDDLVFQTLLKRLDDPRNDILSIWIKRIRSMMQGWLQAI